MYEYVHLIKIKNYMQSIKKETECAIVYVDIANYEK